MKIFDTDYTAYAVFFLVSLTILWDLLLPGYVLTLDMIFADKVRISESFYGIEDPPPSSLPFKLILFLLNKALPMWLIQKILLFLVLFLTPIFMYRVCPANRLGKLFAGLLYLINPFVFVRFLAGHLLILMSYMLLPLLLESLVVFFKEHNFNSAVRLSLVLTGLGMFSNHFIPIAFFMFGVFFIFTPGRWPNKLKISMFMILIYILLNFYWLFPLLSEPDSKLRSMREWIGQEDVAVFSSKSSLSFNVLFNLASMHGFWRAGYDYAKFHIPYWYILFFIILFLSVHGFLTIHNIKEYKACAWTLMVTYILSLTLAAGISYGPTSSIFQFLFDYVPFFRGFREPQKLVAFLALTYSFMGGIAIGDFTSHVKERRILSISTILTLALFTIPFIYSYTMFFGFHDQLDSVWYPESWYRVDDYLSEDEDDFRVLFLPWHMYMDFKFNPKQRIANPARLFFSKDIIQGDNVEVGPIYSQSRNPVSRYIESLLFSKNHENMGRLLAPLNIKYVILAKEVDWENYLFLKNQTDLELIMETNDIILFKNRVKCAKIYETDRIRDSGNMTEVTIDINPIPYRASPTSYILESKPSRKYLVLADVPSDDWKYDGQRPLKDVAWLNVFISSDSKTIRFTSSRKYILAYVVSFTALISILYIKRYFTHA